jgi:hypothetical protein
MRTMLIVALAIVIVGTTLLLAQAAPESEKLTYFAGTWKLKIHLCHSPVSGRVFFGTEQNEWLSGRSLLLSRQADSNVFGGTSVTVMAYDPKTKIYKYHQVKDTGEDEDLSGSFSNGTWTWASIETPQTNRTAKTRLVMKEISGASYSFTVESAPNGQDWSVVMEGIATRITPHAHQDVAFVR